MMDWLKKLFGCEPAKPVAQAIEPEPKPEPKVDPFTAEYDDWEQHHDDWRQIKMCHCGYQMPVLYGVSLAPVGNVCPKCGHTDKWQTKVVRYEWEYSGQMFNAILDYRGAHYVGVYGWKGPKERASRNKRLVEWTEDHCKVSEDSSQ